MTTNVRLLKTCGRWLSLSLLVLPAAIAARAQTADEIISKHLDAMGGRAALTKLTTRKSTGTVTLETPGGNASGPIELYSKAPNKSRATMTLDLTALGAGQMTLDQRFDGAVGAIMNSMQGDTAITGAQLENMRNTIFPSSFLRYKENGVTVTVQPNEEIAGKPALGPLVTPKTGSPERVFLDATSYLIVRTTTTVNSLQSSDTVAQTTDLSDYRTIDGVKVPFHIVNSSPQQSVTITLATVEHNVPIDDAMFVKK